MLSVDEQTAFIGLSELRTAGRDLLKFLQTHKVILTKRNRPVGVLVDYNEYKKMEALIDLIEDTALGEIARERFKSKKESFITHEEMKRRVGLK